MRSIMIKGMLFSVLLLCAPIAQDEAGNHTYRQLFDAGVLAFEAEELGRASAFFRAAGERAPDAPLWRAYRAAAQERAGDVVDVPGATVVPRSLAAWDSVEVAVGTVSWPMLSATGERVLFGRPEAALVDAHSGKLVARLRSRLPPQPDDPGRFPPPHFDGVVWVFDVSGRVVLGLGGSWGQGVGVDVRDSRTGRPIDVEGAHSLDVTPGVRFEWFPSGEVAPEHEYDATVDLASPEGVLRCHLVPLSELESGFRHDLRHAELSHDAGLAMLRDQTVPTRLRIIDRRGERVLLERSPAGFDSLLSPDASCVVAIDDEALWCIDLESFEDRWVVALDAPEEWDDRPAYAFLGQELVRVDATGVVIAFHPETGDRRELLRLEPAPSGPLNGVTFARDGALLIALDHDATLCYDGRSGKQLWAAGSERWFADPAKGTLDAAQELCLIQGEAGQPQVVRLTDGQLLGAPLEPPLWVTSALAVESGKAVIVALSNGELRRVGLADGRTSAISNDSGSAWRRVHPEARGANVLALAKDSSAQLVNATSLETVAGALPGPGATFIEFSRDGHFGVAKDRGAKRTQLVRFTEDLRGQVLHDEPRLCNAAAFSPSGDSLALALEGRLLLLDGRTGELQGEVELPTDVQFNVAAFHREHQLVLGTSAADMGEPYGARVVDRRDGKIIATLNVRDPFGGGTVMHIHSNLEHQVVILTSSACGTVAAFDDVEWKPKYDLDSSGGNWGTLIVRHEAGSSVAGISGMTRSHSRLFDLKTGMIVARAEVEGLFDLALVDAGRRIIGVRDERLTVLDAETYETVYAREEAAGGSAWLLRDGTRRPAPGPRGPSVDPAHIICDGWSAPIDSFDAWLYDPLELAERSLNSLPHPPVILTVTSTAHGSEIAPEGLSITAHSAADPIGAVVEWPNAEDEFVAIAAQHDPDEDPTHGGAWRLRLAPIRSGWTSVRLVDATGVTSRPHRSR
jgi:hypothetical protein